MTDNNNVKYFFQTWWNGDSYQVSDAYEGKDAQEKYDDSHIYTSTYTYATPNIFSCKREGKRAYNEALKLRNETNLKKIKPHDV